MSLPSWRPVADKRSKWSSNHRQITFMLRSITTTLSKLAIATSLFVVASTALGADTSAKVRFQFENASWEEVLKWVGKINNLNIQLEAPPPGKFNYSDPKEYTPEEAFDVLHSALLDRGITLIRKGGLVMTAQLGDDMPWELIPFIPADKLDRVAPHEIVMTTLPLHSVPGDKIAAELTLELTPRGKIIGNKVANRIILYDQAGICLHLRDLLALIDPPLDSEAVRLRIYSLQYARAKEVAPIIREVLGIVEETKGKGGPQPPGPPGGGEGMGAMLAGLMGGGGGGDMNVDALTNVVSNRKFLASFTPGYSMKGVGTEDAPAAKLPTRLSVEPTTNTLSVLAEANILGKVDSIISAIDRPGVEDGSAPILIKSYQLKSMDGEEVAQRLKIVMSKATDVSITGIDRVVVVRGTADHHKQVARLIASFTASDESLAAFRLSRRRATDLVPQLERLFQIEGKQSPRILADSVENAILVRGSQQQVDQVRQMLAELGELAPGSGADPRLKKGGVRTKSPSRTSSKP